MGVMMFFNFLITLVALGATVLVVLLIAKAIGRTQHVRQETFMKVLEKGVYDPSLLGKKRRRNAALGWGIVFVAIGFALLIGFKTLGILSVASTGALVPLFVGVGLIVFHIIARATESKAGANSAPVPIPAEKTVPGRTPTIIGGDGGSGAGGGS